MTATQPPALHRTRRPTGTWPYTSTYRAWQPVTAAHGSAITHPALNDRLAAGAPIGLHRHGTGWLPAAHIEPLRALAADTLAVDETKIRLAGDLLPGTTTTPVHPTPYSAFLVTNHTAAHHWHHGGQPVAPFEEHLHEGAIPDLAVSGMSNHIGADVLALQEGRLLLVRQGAANVLSGGLLAPSGSGSADWADTDGATDLLTAVRAAMVREMTEELGLSGAAIPAPVVIGYARVTHLGGKPQFYGITRLPAARGELDAVEQLYTDGTVTLDLGPAPTLAALATALGGLLTGRARELSFPLAMLAHLTLAWLRRHPDQAAAHLGLPHH